eukprot:gene8340-9912_t
MAEGSVDIGAIQQAFEAKNSDTGMNSLFGQDVDLVRATIDSGDNSVLEAYMEKAKMEEDRVAKGKQKKTEEVIDTTKSNVPKVAYATGIQGHKGFKVNYFDQVYGERQAKTSMPPDDIDSAE